MRRTTFAKRRCHRRAIGGNLDALRLRYGFVQWPGPRGSLRTPRIQYLRGPITWEQGDAILDRGAHSLASFGAPVPEGSAS